MSVPSSEPPGRLISHFKNRGREQQGLGWSALWDSDESSLWDRGGPSPALIEFVESGHPLLPALVGRHPRALVPGCGKGYDVAMLALHGYEVYGLEISETGAQVARDYIAAELAEPSERNYGDPTQWPKVEVGSVKIITGDFFGRDWEDERDGSAFDLIYDYTFLCALLPEMRKDWARRMIQLLSPTGILVCLEFPLYKDLAAVGPPWGLRGVHWNLLAQGRDGRITEPPEETEEPAGKMRRVAYVKPKRSYESGRGYDMISVWKLKG
ncbi:hypothetical protein JDV02_002378 [Purpureocillium takamizusanense]|uniref:Thiol methyltransferase 1 n=1 Tax=Purpureocillium takamizusanense TaxID=2060973 RepID=A0A9Q8QBN8_9HYPO|nr:uncharacterized protein JDV02_002378 [Purpureocillium takamizusanense]UNI15892.1 hypothetical protein JDV02_002378 [Purpureocillium takamizusanense]